MKNPLRFIIIDDDRMYTFICELTMRKLFKNIEIFSFLSPDEGLDFIEKEYSHIKKKIETVLLLDINMPATNGWQVLDKFMLFDRSIKDNFKIYLHSSSMSHFDLEQAKSNPLVTGFIPKPLTKDFLDKLLLHPIHHRQLNTPVTNT